MAIPGVAGADLTALEVSVDKTQLAELDRLFKGAADSVDKILARALNDTGKKIRSMIVKKAAKILPYKQKFIRARVWFRKANRKKLAVRVTAGKYGWPLFLVGTPKQAPAGVRLKKLGVIPHSFIGEMPTGHRGIFVRKGRTRLPIQELFSDSITETIENLGAEPEIVSEARAVLRKRVDAQVKLVLEGKRKA